MSKNEDVPSEYKQLVKIYRKLRDEYDEVIRRNWLDFSNFQNPSDEDLDLAERLEEQVNSALAKMQEFKANLFNRQRGSDSP